MNLVQKSVSRGGKLAALVIPPNLTSGTGLCNPSIFIDDDGDILVNIRCLNYTLYHAEKNQKFPSPWGPLAYLHPEKDQRLVTVNYLCRLDEDYNIINYAEVDYSDLNVEPVWEFVGEEDCRVVRWGGDLYLIGVRRDTTTNGQGRMEYSKIELDKEKWTAKEVQRVRIPGPFDNSSYCEKNWMPVLDMPYHFIKWTMPTELVKSNPNKSETEQIYIKETKEAPNDQRGGAQIIPWKDYYITITHEVVLWKNYLVQKDALYRHRLIVWDREFNFLGHSPENFSFLDGQIEFCPGGAIHNGDLLLTFGFQDNAAFLLRTPGDLVDEMIAEAINA